MISRLTRTNSFYTGNTGLVKVSTKSFLEDVVAAPPVTGKPSQLTLLGVG